MPGNVHIVGSPVAFVASRLEQADVPMVATIKEFGTVDILVHSAQDTRPSVSSEDTTDEDMALALDSGLWGTFHVMQACFLYLKVRGGKIVNLASATGIEGMEGFAAYAAAKEGIRALTRVAAREWAKYGVTVKVVCPFANAPAQQAWAKAHPDAVARNVAKMPPAGLVPARET